jgi:hypothetical protein
MTKSAFNGQGHAGAIEAGEPRTEADDPLADAHTALLGAIAELRTAGIAVPIALHKAMHALSYARARRATDDELGMAWWNGLSERERARWSREAGNTGRAKDAWEAFKRQGGPSHD